ncbi:kelch-like protein 22 isoform X2 [Carcharodon carcharias]|uniref:kelch-like protein 22 isoform X2 n=1 Tax=Carcharodon carcharias TaxID=13397 RepID=UPI001B7F41AF|nr:kelch-like protein 22 isoform X2 [Carcharodon carcharias]
MTMAEEHEDKQKSQKKVSQTYQSSAHSQSLLNGLVALRNSASLFDVTLIVEGKSIEAHRILLAASCDYFRGMFAGGLREMQEKEIFLHEISYMAMCKILDFIYTSEMELNLNNVQDVLVAACQLQIPEVIDFCCDFLISWIDDDNIIELYRLAEHYSLTQLSNKIDLYILQNFLTISKTETYRQLPLAKVQSLLSSDKLHASSENEVYEAALLYHYTQEEIDRDQVSLHDPPKLLEMVRFALIEQQTFQKLYNRLSPCPLKEVLADALAYHQNEILQPVLQTPQTQLRSEFRCVVGFGGMYSSQDEDLSDEVKFLNPLTREWRTLTQAQMPKMSNQGIAVLNNFAYLVGGDNNTAGYRAEVSCWRYDPRHNKWTRIQSLQQPHADHCVCVVGEYMYAIGGRDYHQELNMVERYDPRLNTWEYVAPLKKEVYAHAGAVHTRKIYIACGRSGRNYLKELHCYDPEANQWEMKANAPVERAWHGMAAVRAQLYLLGGSNNTNGYRQDVMQVSCYSPERDQWSTVSEMPFGHGEPGIAVLDEKIFILGGRSHDRYTRTHYVHIYNVMECCWEEAPDIECANSGMSCCVLTLPRQLVEDWGNQTPRKLAQHACRRRRAYMLPEVVGLSDFEEFSSSED